MNLNRNHKVAAVLGLLVVAALTWYGTMAARTLPSDAIAIEGPTKLKPGKLAAYKVVGLVDPKPADLKIKLYPKPEDAFFMPVKDFATNELAILFQTEQAGTYTMVVTCWAVREQPDITITVENPIPPGPPTASITVTPSTILQGESSSRTWTTTGATSALIDNVAVGLSGMDTVSPAATATYTLTAAGPGGATTDTATVTVGEPTPEPGNRFVLVLSETKEQDAAWHIEEFTLRKYLTENSHWFRFEDPNLTDKDGSTPAWLVPFITEAATKKLTLPIVAVATYEDHKLKKIVGMESWPGTGEKAIALIKKYGG